MVRPTISPFSTVKSDLSSGVTQPVRSLPLKSGWNPADSWPPHSATAAARPDRAATKNKPEAGGTTSSIETWAVVPRVEAE